MKLETITETTQDQAETLAIKLNTHPERIIQKCKSINTKYWKWILQQWYQNRIRLPEDSHRIKETLNHFNTISNKLPPEQKDINKYKKLSDIEEKVNDMLGIQSSSKIHNINRPGVKIISQKGPYTTIEITDEETLKDLGEGTKWCTRRSYPDCQAENLLESYGKIFIISQNGRPVVQYTPDYVQVMDINDDPVEDKKLLSLIPKPSIDSNPKYLLNYASNVMKGRWPEAELIMMQDPQFAYLYAMTVIKGRWPEAEPVIMQDPLLAYLYAACIIKGRWPEAEPVILKDPKWADAYHRSLYPSGRYDARPRT